MTNRLQAITFLAAAVLFTFTPDLRATVITSTIPLYDASPDFSGNYPLPAVLVGTFTFAAPTFTIGSITISGTFGNNDVPGTTNVTADSDYYVDGAAIQVAACDTPNIVNTGTATLSCDAGSQSGAPTPWSYTFSSADIATLATELAAGSIDFNVIQNYYGSVETGVTTLTITSAPSAAPEPATLALIPLGLAGIALLRRRKA